MMLIMDCTLRDGANVLGKRFPDDLTRMIMDGLVENKVDIIEYHSIKDLTASDTETLKYLDIAKPYFGRADVGVFMNAKQFTDEGAELVAKAGFSWVRIGINAGEAKKTEQMIKKVRGCGMKVFFAMMKAYLLTPEDLADEAAWLEEQGVYEATIMDSAGYMWLDDARRYASEMKKRTHGIKVGIHSHNNMYMALNNAVEAQEGGADIIDCGLMGMARSAGNIATEAAVAAMYRKGVAVNADLFGLLRFIDDKLMPAMEKHGYHNPVPPLELVLGYSGCHSNFVPLFKQVAKETGKDLYQLIISVSKDNMRNPSEEEIRAHAAKL